MRAFFHFCFVTGNCYEWRLTYWVQLNHECLINDTCATQYEASRKENCLFLTHGQCVCQNTARSAKQRTAWHMALVNYLYKYAGKTAQRLSVTYQTFLSVTTAQMMHPTDVCHKQGITIPQLLLHIILLFHNLFFFNCI